MALIAEQDASREQDLVPVRHGRMMASPFTFYRGTARIMAADLGATPTAGLGVQLCGDAHLSNFGAYSSPERTLVFDLNDFDETLPGPFEYDVKRLATSVTVAARNNAFSTSECRAATLAAVTAYREAMREYAAMGLLEIWYSRLSADALIDMARSGREDSGKKTSKRMVKAAKRQIEKARTRDSLQALSKLAERVDGRYRIVSRPPTVVPAREWPDEFGVQGEVTDLFEAQLRGYRATLQGDRRHLLDGFRLVDVARKVVGVGSVGTRAYIALLEGRDDHDPLFLQVKEAGLSVLEDQLPRSRYANHGQRVVEGQRLMQADSDIFLGWTKGADASRHYYWRQLRDMKGSADVEAMAAPGLGVYAGACGSTLARAHARSGDPVAIAGYLGKNDRFDQAVLDFSERYADQNDRDYEAFTDAIRSGRLEAVPGV